MNTRSRYRPRKAGNRSRNKRAAAPIDVSRYVNKAKDESAPKEHVLEHSFSDFPFSPRLQENIASKGYARPTPIQDKAIPHILKGKDILGIANTGTGKTAAFLLPLVEKVLNDKDQNVIIMAPTRELAIQIDEELRGFVRGLKIFSACCVGGMSINRQIQQLRYRNNFIIGTPGRLKDLHGRGFIDFSSFGTVILDEADRMLDMGFIGDMRFMMERMPKERQTLFFSATLSKEIEKLVHDFLRDPVEISVRTGDTSKNIEQDIVRIGKSQDKTDLLHGLLLNEDFRKVLVFGRTKHGVEKLSRHLVKRGVKANAIHGDKNHSQRQRALGEFRDDKIQVLVATDVAARGLDIPNVTHVINYDVPESHEDYIHRIGRTGRGDKRGKALTFVE